MNVLFTVKFYVLGSVGKERVIRYFVKIVIVNGKKYTLQCLNIDMAVDSSVSRIRGRV